MASGFLHEDFTQIVDQLIGFRHNNYDIIPFNGVAALGNNQAAVPVDTGQKNMGLQGQLREPFAQLGKLLVGAELQGLTRSSTIR